MNRFRTWTIDTPQRTWINLCSRYIFKIFGRKLNPSTPPHNWFSWSRCNFGWHPTESLNHRSLATFFANYGGLGNIAKLEIVKKKFETNFKATRTSSITRMCICSSINFLKSLASKTLGFDATNTKGSKMVPVNEKNWLWNTVPAKWCTAFLHNLLQNKLSRKIIHRNFAEFQLAYHWFLNQIIATRKAEVSINCKIV